MIKEAIGVGKTPEEALENAKVVLDAPFEADVKFEILEMPKKKTLGIFGKEVPAKVRAYYEAPDPVEAPKPVKAAPAKQAKALMDTETDYIIVDARTEEEFAEGHIENAVLIPEYEIAARAETELPDKKGLILVYCRSGRRSKIASEELVKLGYSNVKEFGGIIDWPYETVK